MLVIFILTSIISSDVPPQSLIQSMDPEKKDYFQQDTTLVMRTINIMMIVKVLSYIQSLTIARRFLHSVENSVVFRRVLIFYLHENHACWTEL